MKWPWRKKKSAVESGSAISGTTHGVGRDNNAPTTTGNQNTIANSTTNVYVSSTEQSAQPHLLPPDKELPTRTRLKTFEIKRIYILEIPDFAIDFGQIAYPYISAADTTHMYSININVQIIFGVHNLSYNDDIFQFGLKGCTIALNAENSYIEPTSIFHGKIIFPSGKNGWKIKNDKEIPIIGGAIYKHHQRENYTGPLCTLKSKNETFCVNSSIDIYIEIDDLIVISKDYIDDKLYIEESIKRILKIHAPSDEYISKRKKSDQDIRIKVAKLAAAKDNRCDIYDTIHIGSVEFTFTPESASV